MKRNVSLLMSFVIVLQISCKKETHFITPSPPPEDSAASVSATASMPQSGVTDGALNDLLFDTEQGTDSTALFTTYVIRAGQNYCVGNSYQPDSFRVLQFQALFDSSCIYTSGIPINQHDINKLYGFSDSASFHHQNSARFGWNWEGGAMHIHAYCYRSGLRESKELGTVSLNTVHNFSIEVKPGQYVFTLNGKQTIMARSAQEPVALGYKLLPYFGGDEPAPHEVRIKIRELN